MTEEIKKRILSQLILEPRELIHGESIGGYKAELYGDGKRVLGIANCRGDITDIEGNLSGLRDDVSRFVGCVNGIEGSANEIIEVLEKAGKVIKHRAV